MNGAGSYSFTANVGDNATPGSGVDTFSITVTGPNGFNYCSLRDDHQRGLHGLPVRGGCNHDQAMDFLFRVVMYYSLRNEGYCPSRSHRDV